MCTPKCSSLINQPITVGSYHYLLAESLCVIRRTYPKSISNSTYSQDSLGQCLCSYLYLLPSILFSLFFPFITFYLVASGMQKLHRSIQSGLVFCPCLEIIFNKIWTKESIFSFLTGNQTSFAVCSLLLLLREPPGMIMYINDSVKTDDFHFLNLKKKLQSHYLKRNFSCM